MPVIDRRARVQCCVADLSLFQVQLVVRDGAEYVLGLPLIRPGTWNGVPYTADDMRAIAANHEVIRSVEGTEPPLRPGHAYDPVTGDPIITDATETHAWFTGLAFDEAQQVLFGDARLVDWNCTEGIRSGKLRYLSTEIKPNYTLNDPTTGELREIGPALVGTAWVDNPAVKGLGFEILLNAEGFGVVRVNGPAHGHLTSPGTFGSGTPSPSPGPAGQGKERGTDGSNRATTVARQDTAGKPAVTHRTGSGRKDVRSMGMLEKLRGVLMKLGAKEEDLAELADETPAEPVVNQAAPAPGEDEVSKLRAENAGLKTRLDELQLGLATVTANAAAEKIGLRVDELVRGGFVPPAERATVVNMAVAMSASGTKVLVNMAGQPQERETVDVYLDGLRARGPQVKTHAAGLSYSGSDDPDEVQTYTAEQIAELKAAV